MRKVLIRLEQELGEAVGRDTDFQTMLIRSPSFRPTIGLACPPPSVGGRQVCSGCFQGFFTSRSVFVVDVALAAVQPCLEECDLVNPVGLVFVLLVSHVFGESPVQSSFIEQRCPLG